MSHQDILNAMMSDVLPHKNAIAISKMVSSKITIASLGSAIILKNARFHKKHRPSDVDDKLARIMITVLL
jgi:hypothetical protein